MIGLSLQQQKFLIELNPIRRAVNNTAAVVF
jgi:hypothetical protein